MLFSVGHRVLCAVGIYGGFLLGVRSVSGLAFYDWETNSLVRRIEITPKMVRNRTAAFVGSEIHHQCHVEDVPKLLMSAVIS